MNKTYYITMGISLLLSNIVTAKFIQKKYKPVYAGTIRVDNSDAENSNALFLELSTEGYKKILSNETIVLNVVKENYIKQRGDE